MEINVIDIAYQRITRDPEGTTCSSMHMLVA